MTNSKILKPPTPVDQLRVLPALQTPTGLPRARWLLTDQPPKLTTADAARVLRVTAEGVRYFITTAQLPYERTQSGQYLFQQDDVLQLAAQRAQVALSPIRPRMIRARRQPRQLSLLKFLGEVKTPRLRLVGGFRPPVIAWGSQSEGTRIHSETRRAAS